jgi:DEAD/DEAH box helicase domain-containing protein
VVVDETSEPRVIAETDFTSALSMLHPKAIYMVEGRLFQVERLDFEGRKAYVRAVDCDYYTTAIDYTKVTVLDRFAADAERIAHHGEVHVVSRVVGFKKIKFHTNENVGSGELDLPERQMHTTSYWLEIPEDMMASLPYTADDRRDGVFGLAFAMKNVAQLLLMCDQRDIGLSVTTPGAESLADIDAGLLSRIFLYDAYPGGIGFSAPLYAMHSDLLARTSSLIAGCDCENGCPTCVGPVGETGPMAKTVALRLLSMLMGPAGAQLDGDVGSFRGAGTEVPALLTSSHDAGTEVPALHTGESGPERRTESTGRRSESAERRGFSPGVGDHPGVPDDVPF